MDYLQLLQFLSDCHDFLIHRIRLVTAMPTVYSNRYPVLHVVDRKLLVL